MRQCPPKRQGKRASLFLRVWWPSPRVPSGTACGDSFLSTHAIVFFSSLWLVSLIMIAASAYALQFLTATRDRARLQNAAPYLHSELFNHGNRVEQRFLFSHDELRSLFPPLLRFLSATCAGSLSQFQICKQVWAFLRQNQLCYARRVTLVHVRALVVAR